MNLEEKIIGNIKGGFKIEAYQRGYRWSDDEIKHLLEDIEELPFGQKYCLQPVVVKDIDGVYELIDGQQRMTTLYLIMKYLKTSIGQIKYTIEYTTRKSENGHMGSKELLENIDTIDLNSKSTNIDELFIKKAYLFIKNWFNGDNARMNMFAIKLQQFVSVIWYEVDKDENSVDIFTRLNIGKINLTNAELVKALFLSRGKKGNNGYEGNPYGIEEKRQPEIALEWDAMEKGLHDDNFWSFITNEKAERYPIRMELFFDIMEKKPNNEDNYYTFNRFVERFKNADNKYKTWETLVRYYQQLKEWYKDFDLYHQIGFLVATGASIKELLDLAMDENSQIKKSQFREEIVDRIRKSVRFIKKGGEGEQEEELDYAELNYELHKPFIQTLLLLFNVETIRQKGDKGMRFPFDSYKNQGVWSLEHIHAQNSESLRSNPEWREWLVLHKKSLLELKKTLAPNNNSEDDKLKDRIDKTCGEIDAVIAHIDDKNFNGSIREEFSRVSPLVVDILSNGDDNSMMHTISNMALLTVGENAALNNSTFDVKRMKIIDMDKKGDYIPVCTKNVFMKYYSLSDTKLHFWSEDDRKYYIDAMNYVLYDYAYESGKEIKLINSRIHYGRR